MKRFSFIVVGRSVDDCGAAVEALSRLVVIDGSTYEILLATGNKPSYQRNAAAREAAGEYLIFLDNDSCVDPALLKHYDDALKWASNVGVAGGPSLYRDCSSVLKIAANAVLSSPVGLGPFRSRYQSTGQMRGANERSLILCNLLIKRDLFLENGGFSRDLYPNEENELLTRLSKKTTMVYNPFAICHRDPRDNVGDFALQFFGYGLGRAKHYLFLRPTWNWILFLPSLLAVYLLLLPILFLISPELILPAAFYFSVLLAEGTRAAILKKRPAVAFYAPLLFLVCHFSYGLGFMVGGVQRILKLNRKPKREAEVTVTRI